MDHAHEILHEVVVKNDDLSSLSVGSDIAMITVASQDFIDTPGIITRVTEPLRKQKINIVGDLFKSNFCSYFCRMD